MNLLNRPRPQSRRLLGVVLLALLFAQWTALTHAIAHAPVQLPAASAVAPDAAADHDGAAWGHAAGSSACVFVDQLLIGGAVGSEAPPPLAAPDAAAAPSCWPPALVARVALPAYEARGPPGA